MIGLVCVGNDPSKLLRLLKLVDQVRDEIPTRRVVVYNGPGTFNGAIKVPNVGWDARMYYEGTSRTECARNIYLNDDVLHIEPGALAQMHDKLEEGFEVVGAQGNQASWCHPGFCPSMQRHRLEQQGDGLRFIRTHAFACTREYFYRVWILAKQNGDTNGRGKHLAHVFEKATILLAKSYALLPDPSLIYDSDTEPYVKKAFPYKCEMEHRDDTGA
jgi:hypothetical protein